MPARTTRSWCRRRAAGWRRPTGPRAWSSAQRSMPSAMTASIGCTAAASSSPWSATTATPPTRRQTCSASTPSRSAPCCWRCSTIRWVGRHQDAGLGGDGGGLVAHGAGDLGRTALVHADEGDVGLEPAEQELARRSLEGQRLVGRLGHPLDPRLHHRVEQRVAGGEVAVERARADARLLGDVVERRVVAALAEDHTGHLHDAVAVALGVGSHNLPLLNGDSLRMVDPVTGVILH